MMESNASRRLLLIILVGWVWALPPQVHSAIRLTDGFTSLLLAPEVELFFDPTGKFELADVIGKEKTGLWQKSQQDTPNFGYITGAVWVRVRVSDERKIQDTIRLEIGYTLLNTIDFYDIQGDQIVRQFSGDHVSRDQWQFDERLPSFELNSNRSHDIYIRVHSTRSVQLPLLLSTAGQLEAKRYKEDIIQALYYGAIVVIAIYNLLVCLGTGLRVYGYYVGFLVGYAAFQLALSGYGYFTIWPAWPGLTDAMVFYGMISGCIFSTAFTINLLDLDSALPRSRYFQYYQQLIGLVITILFLTIGYKSTILFALVSLVIPWLLFLIVAGFVSQRRGERVAKWYLLAWSFFIFGSLISVSRQLGILPTTLLTNYAQQIGSVIEFILLSFALADRIKTLQERIHVEQSLALSAERHARDSDQKALAAAEAALEEHKRLAELKDQFLANTSHELRTPLNGMIGMAESLLTKSYFPAEDWGDLNEILSAANRLSHQVGQILDYSQLRKGTMSLEIKSLDLQPLLLGAFETLRPKIEAKGVTCSLQIEAGKYIAWVDPKSCLETFQAVLNNAYKFTEHGRIIVTARRVEPWIEVGIRDSGLGIAADRLTHINLAFEQSDGGSDRKHGGVGLGLALAFQLMQAQSGSLEVSSTLGVGTTIILRFPQSKEPAELVALPLDFLAKSQPLLQTKNLSQVSEQYRESVALPKSPNAPRNSTRVLVVDDDALNRKVVLRYLDGEAFDLFEAESGKEALEIFHRVGGFGLILLDIMMPNMNGYDVCRELRRYASAVELPILMLTAKQELNDLLEGFESGANDYIHKPFQREELRARSRAHISFARTSRAMKCFVPENFIRLLGYTELADVVLGEAIERKMTIGFTDIKGFTRALENKTPAEAFHWLNSCYAVMGPEVRKAAGFIDKYIGDAVMALFPHSAEDSIEAAIAMHQSIKELENVQLGTGIHYGLVMLGTVGEPERFEVTALSDSVNVAARIEGACKILGAQVLVSLELMEQLKNRHAWQWRKLGPVRLKGRQAPVILFELLDADIAGKAKATTLMDFEVALHSFGTKQLSLAILYYSQILEKNPEDRVVQFFHQSAKYWLGRPDFDGMLSLLDK